MPLLLHLDTAGSSTQLLLSRGNDVLSRRIYADSMQQSALLHVWIQELLDEARCIFKMLDAVCVVNGPGSYTGLRVGLSTAKGYCFALGIPLILHHRLMLLYNDVAQGKKAAVLLQARLGEYYGAAFEGEHELLSPQHILGNELLNMLQQKEINTAFVENERSLDFGLNQKQLPTDLILSPNTLVCAGLKAFEQQDFASVAYSEPFYLKAVHTTISKK